MTLPPLSAIAPWADLEQRTRQWGVGKTLIHPDGKPHKGSIRAQHRKFREEVHEAKDALAKAAAAPMDDALNIAAATELGDVLVTLILLAAMRGVTLESCLQPAPLMGKQWYVPATWEKVSYWIAELATCLLATCLFGEYPHKAEWKTLGILYRCVEDIAHRALSRSVRECLLLALMKIEKRQGAVIDGAFVKA